MIGSIGSHVTHGVRLKVSLLRTLSSNNIIKLNSNILVLVN